VCAPGVAPTVSASFQEGGLQSIALPITPSSVGVLELTVSGFKTLNPKPPETSHSPVKLIFVAGLASLGACHSALGLPSSSLGIQPRVKSLW